MIYDEFRAASVLPQSLHEALKAQFEVTRSTQLGAKRAVQSCVISIRHEKFHMTREGQLGAKRAVQSYAKYAVRHEESRVARIGHSGAKRIRDSSATLFYHIFLNTSR